MLRTTIKSNFSNKRLIYQPKLISHYSTNQQNTSSSSVGNSANASSDSKDNYDNYYRDWNFGDRRYCYGPFRSHRRRRFGFFIFGVLGLWAAYSVGKCNRHDYNYPGNFNFQFDVDKAYSQINFDDGFTKIVKALQSDKKYVPIKNSETHLLIEPTTNSQFKQIIVLPTPPLEFENTEDGSRIAVFKFSSSLQDNHWRRHGNHRWGSNNNNKTFDKAKLVLEEYMKSLVSEKTGVKTGISTIALSIDREENWNHHTKNFPYLGSFVIKTAPPVIIPNTVKSTNTTATAKLSATVMTCTGETLATVEGQFSGN